jgi:hypothetical protein
MTTENLDLTHLSIGEADRHVGHLLRQALTHTQVGALVLVSPEGNLSFLDAAVLMMLVDTDRLIPFLMALGMDEERVVEVVASLEGEDDGDSEG